LREYNDSFHDPPLPFIKNAAFKSRIKIYPSSRSFYEGDAKVVVPIGLKLLKNKNFVAN
jgi:hypothetical protein